MRLSLHIARKRGHPAKPIYLPDKATSTGSFRLSIGPLSMRLLKGLVDANEVGSIEAQEIECQQPLEQDKKGDEITETLVRSLVIPHDHSEAGT